ncbi:MAG: Hsp20/alpha crystallin family protein [Firmicutes bacterium]|nr:Hsp20/alpha crystallin family protein [Bacillota bacterium]
MANLIPFRRRMLREQWNPFADFMQLANALWDEGMMPSGLTYPNIDIGETPEAYVIKADVPGYSKGDLEIELDGNTLTIKGNNVVEEQSNSPDLIYQERRMGKFRRAFALPGDIDAEKAEAGFENGVLEIHLPKAGGRGRRLTIN